MRPRERLVRLGAMTPFGTDPTRDVAIVVLRVVRTAALAFGGLGLFAMMLGAVFIGLAVTLAAMAVILSVHNELGSPRPSVHGALAVTGIVTVGVRFLGVVTDDAWAAATRGADVVVIIAGLVAVVLTERRELEAIGFWLMIVTASTGLAVWTTAVGAGAFAVDLAGTSIAFLVGGILIRLVRAALDDRQSRYRLIMDISPIGIVEIDLSGVVGWMARTAASGVADLEEWLADDPIRFTEAIANAKVVAANERVLELLGFPNLKAMASAMRSMPSNAAPAAALREQLLGMWRGQLDSRSEMNVVYPNGDSRTLLFAAAAGEVDGEPDPGHMVITLADIVPQKRAERALQQQIAMRDRFVASVSHELRTPIAAVHGLTQELVDRPQDFSDEEREDLLRLIADQSADVANIVADLLVAARADAGAMVVHVHRVDVGILIRSVAAEMSLNGIVISTEGNLTALADAIRLRQVLRNLLTNAFRYGGPHVRVSAHNGGTEVHIEVRDDGRPIPAEAQDRMFLPYERTHTLGTTDAVGIGLSVARTLARLMGGDLTYRWDRGESIFAVRMPAAAQTAVADIETLG